MRKALSPVSSCLFLLFSLTEFRPRSIQFKGNGAQMRLAPDFHFPTYHPGDR